MSNLTVQPVESLAADDVPTADIPGTGDPGAGLFHAHPAPAASPLADLHAKLASIVDELYVDFEVPRWDVPPPRGRGMGMKVFVRYGPVSPSHAQRVQEMFQKRKIDDWEIQTNAQVLADACIGVYAMLPGDETQYSLREGDPLGRWTRFDPDLAAMLGPALVKGATAVDVVRATYCTDGDVTIAALQLGDWSAQASKDAEADFPRP